MIILTADWRIDWTRMRSYRKVRRGPKVISSPTCRNRRTVT
jgi:hypothetical protein